MGRPVARSGVEFPKWLVRRNDSSIFDGRDREENKIELPPVLIVEPVSPGGEVLGGGENVYYEM
jgi:hypothetical protein